MQARASLRDARALLPDILGDEAATLALAHEQITSTGMAVLTMADASGRPRLVVKIPTTGAAARGMRRESDVLASLHADARLGDWRRLVPRIVAEGRAREQAYRVDAALPGAVPADGRAADGRDRLLAAAAETIRILHERTAVRASGGRALAERWVDAPLNDLWPRRIRRRRLRARIDRLREELHGAVTAGRFEACWVHGDFWTGNLLVGDDGVSVSGIVDWDAATNPGLALHDLVHLVLYARRTDTGQELGRLVRERLRGKPWPEHERRLLGRHAWDGGPSERHSLLLYWLRHAAVHARQQSRRGPRYELWVRRNVHAVLDEL